MSDYAFRYDDSRLRALNDSLTELQKGKGIRAAVRAAGQKMRRAVVAEVRSRVSGAEGRRAVLEKGVRLIVYRKTAGFLVTVGESRGTGKGIHLNRYGKLRPVLRWLDTGVRRARRGDISPRGLIARAEEAAGGAICAEIENAYWRYVRRKARQNGCDV